MTDQLLGWLGHADGVLLAATPVLIHLRAFILALGCLVITSLLVLRAVRSTWRGSAGPDRSVAGKGERHGGRRHRSRRRT